MLKKSIRKVDLGDNKSYVTVTLEDEPSDEVGFIKTRQHAFLEEFMYNRQLWNCDSELFQDLKMSHNGTAWIITLTATIKILVADVT